MQVEVFRAQDDAFAPLGGGHLFWLPVESGTFLAKAEREREYRTSCRVLFGASEHYAGPCLLKVRFDRRTDEPTAIVLVQDKDLGWSREPKLVHLCVPAELVGAS